eukprot:618528-Hanusia_phi.AAC.2
MDTDGSGTLDKEEIGQALKSMGFTFSQGDLDAAYKAVRRFSLLSSFLSSPLSSPLLSATLSYLLY